MALVSPSPQPRKPFTPEELSEYLSVPTRTLERWRSQRTGPLFIRVGVHVRYRADDVDQWIADLLDETNDWFNITTGRPPLAPGEHGRISFKNLNNGKVRARVVLRDVDGATRDLVAAAATRGAANRKLEARL